MQRYMLQALAIFFAATLWTSCDKKDNSDINQTEDTFKLSGNAAGANERPDPVTTDAAGTLTGTYHSENNALSYTISWTNLTAVPAAMHFHGPAGPEETASPIVSITGFPTTATGTYSDTATLTDAQETDLLAGKWYYNIHTSNHPGGEIRGQVTAAHD